MVLFVLFGIWSSGKGLARVRKGYGFRQCDTMGLGFMMKGYGWVLSRYVHQSHYGLSAGFDFSPRTEWKAHTGWIRRLSTWFLSITFRVG
ncbi:hypothetical protein VTJ04DRAFT_3664 [Mycothermus thermophilus]|uniref:uncharacterized protein n=1 Tax=Humicola insolens TaxID=85995 RepID=UPI00374452FC